MKRIKQRNELYSFFGSRNEVKESLESGILSVKQDDLINTKWAIAKVQEEEEHLEWEEIEKWEKNVGTYNCTYTRVMYQMMYNYNQFRYFFFVVCCIQNQSTFYRNIKFVFNMNHVIELE